MWVELLDARRAAAELEHALVLARLSGTRLWIDVIAPVLASLHVSAGRLDQAATVLEDVIRSDEPGQSAMQWSCWLVRAELELARDAPARCLELVDQVERASGAQWMEHGNPRLLKLRADALARLRRFDEAERTYLAGRASAALIGHRPLGWRIDAALAHLYAAGGRSADADAAGQRARATIADLAATIPDHAAREHFSVRAGALLPIAPPAHRRSVPASRLTPRELEVLRCLIEGESDRTIAAGARHQPADGDAARRGDPEQARGRLPDRRRHARDSTAPRLGRLGRIWVTSPNFPDWVISSMTAWRGTARLVATRRRGSDPGGPAGASEG